MIEFEFSSENAENRVAYWLGTTKCTREDAEHQTEIYEQLDAQTAGLA
jgi:hypothetical protein